MKTIFISYNLAHTDKVQAILDKNNVRGFTRWDVTYGRGSKDGEPHYGTHTWPAMNASILTIVEDQKVAPLLERLKKIDEDHPDHGLRAFVWHCEQMI
jgi:nitrogen regulatory protein PII